MLNQNLLLADDGYNIQRSLRFRSSASAYLNRTQGTSTNQSIGTWSFWFKRGTIGVNQRFFEGHTASSDTGSGNIEFGADNCLYVGGWTTNWRVTTQVFRDPSAWYHAVVVFDTTQATANNRVKVYINGTEVTAFSTTNNPTQNSTFGLNNNSSVLQIGRRRTVSSNDLFFDGYLAEVNFIDGQALTPSSFGQTNSATGVWQPIKYTGTYGTNGFYLPFTNTTSTSTLGNDFSGNSNTWTVNNISLTSGSTYDSMTDVPTLTSATTANYAVLNPLNKASNITITNGNLLATNAVGAIENVRSTMPTAGTLSYWEYTATTVGSSLRMEFGGILSSYNQSVSNTSYLALTGPTGTFGAFWNSGLTLYVNGSSVFTNGSANIVANDVIQFAHDSSTGKLWLGLNGTWYNSGNPAAGTGNVATLTAETVFPAMMMNGGGGTNAASANFGQRPFAYTPPTGFKALNTFNLPTPTIGATSSTTASNYMAATTFNGIIGGTQTITNTVNGTSFQPDLVWMKLRSGVQDHFLVDSVRGSSNILVSNSTAAEITGATTFVTSLNSNGWSLGSGGYGNGTTVIGWQWRASNAAGVTNTAGSITSTVSANTTAGFSIVTYTGNNTSGATVGHGLGVAPAFYIVKQRTASSATSWYCYHSSIDATPQNYAIYLNLTNAKDPSSLFWNNTAPTSSVFSLGTSSGVNGSSGTYVAYCFAQVAGYSAFGSYTGNGSTDGPFVFTGFRPKYVLTKSSSGAENWYINDSARDTYNPDLKILAPNTSDAEVNTGSTWMDLLSNGFKIRYNGSPFNTNGSTYIYMAFAENPFKYSLAR